MGERESACISLKGGEGGTSEDRRGVKKVYKGRKVSGGGVKGKAQALASGNRPEEGIKGIKCGFY